MRAVQVSSNVTISKGKVTDEKHCKASLLEHISLEFGTQYSERQGLTLNKCNFKQISRFWLKPEQVWVGPLLDDNPSHLHSWGNGSCHTDLLPLPPPTPSPFSLPLLPCLPLSCVPLLLLLPFLCECVWVLLERLCL